MYTPHDFTVTDNPPLPNLSSTCFVPPKATGVASLILQFTLLIISVLVVLFFFYHIGGHECANYDDKHPLYDAVSYSIPLDSSANYSESTTGSPEDVSTAALEWMDVNLTRGSIYNQDITTRATPLSSQSGYPGPHPSMFGFVHRKREDDSASERETTSEIPPSMGNCSNLFNFVKNTTIYLDFLGVRLNIFELIHMSTVIYIGIAILWLASILLLLFSMRCRILDMVFLNAVLLTIASTYSFLHALLIALLLHDQWVLAWQTMAIVIGCTVTLICTTVLCTIALALVIAWYRYIVSMDNSKCYCCHGIMKAIKKIKRAPQRTAQDYAMPDVTRHSQLPYVDDRPQNNFTSF